LAAIVFDGLYTVNLLINSC